MIITKKQGVLYWKVALGKRINIGDRAGSLNKATGYRHVGVLGKLYSEHRLIWCMVHGYFPENQIDHINGIRDDNRIANLREVSRMCNAQNKGISAANTSCFPGVTYQKKSGKYYACIGIDGITYPLGLYDTSLEAALARYTAEDCDPRWRCNHRSVLIKAIKKDWPDFNPKQQRERSFISEKDIIEIANLSKKATKIKNDRRKLKEKFNAWVTAVSYKIEVRESGKKLIVDGLLLLPGKLPFSLDNTYDKIIAEIEKERGLKVSQLLDCSTMSRLIK